MSISSKRQFRLGGVRQPAPSILIANSHQGVDLSSLVPQLDTTASDIVAHQRDSLVQRKEVAQKTKDFRKLDDAAKLAEIKVLLKGEVIYMAKSTILRHF
jgi:hypothetical protein